MDFLYISLFPYNCSLIFAYFWLRWIGSHFENSEVSELRPVARGRKAEKTRKTEPRSFESHEPERDARRHAHAATSAS